MVVGSKYGVYASCGHAGNPVRSGIKKAACIDLRDIRNIRFKRVRFDINKYLLKMPQDKYFLGLDDRRKPITISNEKMTEHIHILGGSGSGKTNFAVIPLCIQAIQRGAAVISIDFKGDKQAIHLLAQEAQAAGRRFYFFSLDRMSIVTLTTRWPPVQRSAKWSGS